MSDFGPAFDTLQNLSRETVLDVLPEQLRPTVEHCPPRWRYVLQKLPDVVPSSVDCAAPRIRIGDAGDCDAEARRLIALALHELDPWRKGPFSVFGIPVDTEWRSDWKWQRVQQHIQPLDGRLVLDVGCGNGYYGWRMRAAGAALVVGIDPYETYIAQFVALSRYIGCRNVFVLPLGIDALPGRIEKFDTVFSMGVLYHRRSPLDHLLELRGALASGGELVLETLVIDGEDGRVLVPRERYAKMNNVWFIPSCATLAGWIRRCGFSDVRLVDVTVTTTAEQRRTEWMTFESLEDFLDPADCSRTVEGYPAPQRAVFTAVKP